MSRHDDSRHGWVGGVILIVLGVLFLLDTNGILDLHLWRLLRQFWPSILILVGLMQFLTGRARTSRGPLFLIGLGAILQVAVLRVFPWWTMRNFWPLVLILIGVLMLAGRLRSRPAPPLPYSSGPPPASSAPPSAPLA